MTPSLGGRTQRLINEIGRSLEIPLVLVDVGASIEVHTDFRSLAAFSTVVAFDADDRELPEGNGSQVLVVNKAVVCPEMIVEGEAAFVLTKNPTLSSTLEPDYTAASGYSLARRLDPIKQTQVPATTLSAAMEEHGLERIDWLKLDTQGTDGRLVASLSERLQQRLLCVDVEPGTDAFYHGEDTFEVVHALMKSSGFWLARMESIDAARISRDSLATLVPFSSALMETAVDISLSGRYGSPVAANLRYFRNPKSAYDAGGGEGLRRLWLCAMASGLHPFAFEVARYFEAAEPSPEAAHLVKQSRRILTRRLIAPIRLARKFTKGRIRRARISHF